MRKLILFVLILAVSAAGCRQQPPISNSTPADGAASPARSSPGSASLSEPAANGGEEQTPRANDRAATEQEQWREITIPAGTRLPIRLEQTLASDASRVEEPVHATLLNSIVVKGMTVVPAGSTVRGVVTDATRAGRVKGRARVGVRFDTLDVKGSGEPYSIRTGLVTRQARSTKGKDAATIGVPALGGVVLGGIFGGKKGAIVGGTVGGGTGTAVVLSTRGEEVRLPRGTHLAVKLLAPVTVRVKV